MSHRGAGRRDSGWLDSSAVIAALLVLFAGCNDGGGTSSSVSPSGQTGDASAASATEWTCACAVPRRCYGIGTSECRPPHDADAGTQCAVDGLTAIDLARDQVEDCDADAGARSCTCSCNPEGTRCLP